MDNDIRPILEAWPHKEGANIRRIGGADGRDKLQVRLPMGIEQYEVDGRPDGVRPEGFESYLAYYRSIAAAEGAAWELDQEAFTRLYEEGLLFYRRYLLFFQLGEYDLCVRDTARNLELADFVSQRASSPAMSEAMEQYRPYILRMRAVSLAVRSAKAQNVKAALEVIAEAIEEIEKLPPVKTRVFKLEKTRSLVALRDLGAQLKRQERAFNPDGVPAEGPLAMARVCHATPPSRADRLREELAEAVAAENYERAAGIRDELRRLDGEKASPPA